MWNVVSSVLSFCFQPARNLFLEQTKYILKLEDHLEALQEVSLSLTAVKDDLQNQIEMEERKGLRVLKEFNDWLSKVEAIQPKVTKLLEDSTAEVDRLSMCGYCSSNLFLTYCYGKDVFETLERVKSIMSSKPSGEVARMGPPPGIVKMITQRTVGLEKMLEVTWRRLMEKEVGILGLYGMGGIGKTTLLKQLNNKLLEKRDEFEVVIYAEVSKNIQVEKIQNEIGERLGLCGQVWEKKTQNEKASGIYDALTRKRFVILLDDIWRKLKIEEDIGIPLPSPKNGSKVVFTTRLQTVCGRMGSHDLEVKQLDPGNAWELFRQKVGDSTLASEPKINELAIQICEKCQGLPLALNVIGETMARKTSIHDWKCAIADLESNAAGYPEVKDEILKVLKLSYDDLENETEQQCFQFCALLPDDELISKEALVQYWISEGIINVDDRERAIDHGYRIIGILVSACLLMPFFTFEYVTMHDVIHQMALWAASNFGKEKEKVIVKTGAGLQQMPEDRDWNAVTRMSLAKTEIQNISISPECPNLTTLLLTYNNLVNISGDFFLSMPKLVILDLSHNKSLTKLPEEVSSLVSLRHLDLAQTSLENLPVGLGKLIQLRYFDLTDVRTLQSISVISSLVNIEMLFLHEGSIFLSLELIEEIKLMRNLKGLGVTINNMVVLERLLSIPKLASCIQYITLKGIVAKDGPLQFEAARASLRYIMIRESSIFDIVENTRYGCRSTSAISFQNLSLVIFSGVSGIQDLSWLIFAPNLTIVSVDGPSPELQEIVSSEKVSGVLHKGSSIVPFRKLHAIRLVNLEGLKSIYSKLLELPSLMAMTIRNCPKLKKLPISTKVLDFIQRVDIVADEELCEKLEDEATEDSEDEATEDSKDEITEDSEDEATED
ncbi:unnamed protein product [Eruca vesicaria subsp. sativa]|uniref:AAA+ ATPase domain-containing protein n=1 Tax=Eruca vesicaria subsp. sativa TaxID=29727 RepID=A0ABC8JME1_ERUVS|nr:unnamed protein product [Eruca vesicaria subsp. sativa]